MGRGGKGVCASDGDKDDVLGPEHPDTLMSIWNLSHALRDLGRNAETLSLLQACVQLLVQ